MIFGKKLSFRGISNELHTRHSSTQGPAVLRLHHRVDVRAFHCQHSRDYVRWPAQSVGAVSMVRFAMLCDKCGARSGEYESWPTCKDCGEDTCSDCDVDSERTEDEANKTLCLNCRIERSREEPS